MIEKESLKEKSEKQKELRKDLVQIGKIGVQIFGNMRNMIEKEISTEIGIGVIDAEMMIEKEPRLATMA